MRLSSLLLLCLVVVVGADGIVKSPVEGFLDTVNDAVPVLRDVFFSVFGEVNKTAFRSALRAAVERVNLIFPTQPPPLVPERWWGEEVHNDTCIRPFTVHFSHENKTAFRSALRAAVERVNLIFPTQPPPLVPERWWGEEVHNDTCIRPFTVHFSHEMISDLRRRIHNRRNITHALRGTANTYGTNAAFLAQLLDQWADAYDFRGREDLLNNFPQYVTNIQGLDIHYIHVKPVNPQRKKVLPLLLLHGFPVTAFEYVHVIRYLLEERENCDFVFEIIVPDLPGYGFSEATYYTGMAQYQMGIIMKNLMLRLGKPRFYIHAGDIGHCAADAIAVLFPDMVLGFHSNFASSFRPQTLTKLVLGQLYPPAVVEARYKDRMYPLSAHLEFYLENFGYFHMQASKPDNVGHGLDDSPVGLVSWLLQNIMMATNPTYEKVIDGNLPRTFDMNDWFDTFTIYWATSSTTTAQRSYAEFFAVHQDPLSLRIAMTPTPVLFATVKFKHELVYQPDDFLRDKYPNLVQSTTLDFGGHFAGYQAPVVLADSIWTSVARMEHYRQKDTVY